MIKSLKWTQIPETLSSIQTIKRTIEIGRNTLNPLNSDCVNTGSPKNSQIKPKKETRINKKIRKWIIKM